MKVRFGVNISSGPAFISRADLSKFEELVKVIDGYGVDVISTYDTSFIGGDAFVRATLTAQAASHARVGLHPTFR